MAALKHAIRHCRRIPHNYTFQSLLCGPTISSGSCVRCLSTNRWQSLQHAPNLLTNVQLAMGGYRLPVRFMSKGSGKGGFISSIIENIQQDMKKNKEMKDNLEKFREEKEKLDQSDGLKAARKKYEVIEGEAKKLRDRLTEAKAFGTEKLADAEKTEIYKKLKDLTDEVADLSTKTGQKIGESQAFKSINQSVSQGLNVLKQEIDDVTSSRANVYKAPEVIRRRESETIVSDEKIIEANEDATGVELHKDAKWKQQWQDFKDNNQYVNKLYDIKTKYEESDHLLARATRGVTEKFTSMFGSVFTQTEMSEVLTEIVKMDPTFDKEAFLVQLRTDLIPNIMEAYCQEKHDILDDWCHEGVFNVLVQPSKAAKSMGQKITRKVLDISHVELAVAKMTDMGPVLMITFNAQEIAFVRNSSGKIVEGDADQVVGVSWVWVFCRDQTILDPKAAWRLMEAQCDKRAQFI